MCMTINKHETAGVLCSLHGEMARVANVLHGAGWRQTLWYGTLWCNGIDKYKYKAMAIIIIMFSMDQVLLVLQVVSSCYEASYVAVLIFEYIYIYIYI